MKPFLKKFASPKYSLPPLLSSYLDLVRFAAALVVFLGHASSNVLTGGLFWRLSAYADTCVVVFFVLSGYVITYVVDVKEKNFRAFAISRISRLWSVVLPALVLTFLVDYLGVRIAKNLYFVHPWFEHDYLFLRYLMSFFMLQNVWHLGMIPGINRSFWSLTYEAAYYFIFAMMFFMRGNLRWASVALTILITGPAVGALFPLWGLGYVVYQCKKFAPQSDWISGLFFGSGLALLACAPYFREVPSLKFSILGEPILVRYLDGIAFSLNLIGAMWLSEKKNRLPLRLESYISWIANSTFVLYLFHRPLIQFFSYIGPSEAGSIGRRLLVVCGTLSIVFLLTPVTEKFRVQIRSWLQSGFYAHPEQAAKQDVA